MALPGVLDLLVCPHCRSSFQLTGDGRAVRCSNGHAFDLARQGYLNLQAGRPPRNADTAAMVAARDRFLSGGHYRPILERLLELVGDQAVAAPRVLEVGAGTGYYLAGLLNGLPGSRGVALDVSVAATRRAARAHPQLGAVVADVWQPLPVGDACCDLVVDVFAPRNAAEFRRVVTGPPTTAEPPGMLVVVTPEPDHLAQLREHLGLLEIQPDKQDQLHETLGRSFARQSQERVAFELILDAAALHDLVAMGPNAFHSDEEQLQRSLEAVPLPARVDAAVNVSSWRPRP